MIEAKHKLTEEEWWDVYGQVQEQVWVYDHYFERAVRSGYLQEMIEFLFKPGGRVLDFGCGSGWVGLRLAERGMRLEGVDLSAEQIKQARYSAQKRGIANARFWQGGVEVIEGRAAYDSIIVHSLFHHLSQTDQRALLQSVGAKLVDGGKAYFYEPLAAKSGSDLVGRVLNKSVLGMLWALRKLVYWLHWQETTIREAVEAGWTMQSPDEAPLDLEQFITMLPPGLNVIKITSWHMAAIAYANLCMGLKPTWQKIMKPGIVLFQVIDRIVLSPRYRNYMRAWPMTSMMLVKTQLENQD